MILLCGKTCSGKDTIRNELLKEEISPIITYTTRPMRKGEINGVTYHFISKWKFYLLKLIGFFAETTYYNVATGERWYYGTSKKSLGKENTVIIVNPEGLKKIKRRYKNAFAVFIEASTCIIGERLTKRGDNQLEAVRRIAADNEDFKDIERYCDFAIENNGKETMENIVSNIIWEYNMEKTVEEIINNGEYN